MRPAAAGTPPWHKDQTTQDWCEAVNYWTLLQWNQFRAVTHHCQVTLKRKLCWNFIWNCSCSTKSVLLLSLCGARHCLNSVAVIGSEQPASVLWAVLWLDQVQHQVIKVLIHNKQLQSAALQHRWQQWGSSTDNGENNLYNPPPPQTMNKELQNKETEFFSPFKVMSAANTGLSRQDSGVVFSQHAVVPRPALHVNLFLTHHARLPLWSDHTQWKSFLPQCGKTHSESQAEAADCGSVYCRNL